MDSFDYGMLEYKIEQSNLTPSQSVQIINKLLCRLNLKDLDVVYRDIRRVIDEKLDENVRS